MSPSFFPSSMGSFSSSTASAPSRAEPELIEYPDNSGFYRDAYDIGRLAYMRARIAAYLGPPVPVHPDDVYAIDEMEAKGLPGIESDVLAEYLKGWNDAKAEAEAYDANKS